MSLVLELPKGVLDPKGFATVEVVLHEPSGDTTRSANLSIDGSFDLGVIDPTASVSIEATLRNLSGAAVGYGRTATATAFAGGAEIVVPVRRPITYFAGTVSTDADGDAETPELAWTQAPATFSDLSISASLDGSSRIGDEAVMMIAAGPSLYMVTQATSDPDGALTGPAKVVPVSAAHEVGAALDGAMTGAVIDGVGSDDGKTLVIGTSTQLFTVDTATGAVRSLASGRFERVALVATDSGELTAIAIRNRGDTTASPCRVDAELWWAPISGGADMGSRIATGGFSDVAADRGRGYYVDACKAEIGEVTAAAATALRSIAEPDAEPGVSRPTAIAVSNGQAYIGIETPPSTTALMVASLTSSEEPRTLWSESAQQVLEALNLPVEGVQRRLDASSAVVQHLEVGAGGDYVALTTRAHFDGAGVEEANIPEMTIDTEELRVFDAATGGAIQRYRSWCDGVLLLLPTDIPDWVCSSTAGQSEAADVDYEHHINSMTFLFGKK